MSASPTPTLVIYSIDIIYSYRPSCFFPLGIAIQLYRVNDPLVDPIEKPISSILKIAKGGYLFSRKTIAPLIGSNSYKKVFFVIGRHRERRKKE
jgi:hypothetical protein